MITTLELIASSRCCGSASRWLDDSSLRPASARLASANLAIMLIRIDYYCCCLPLAGARNWRRAARFHGQARAPFVWLSGALSLPAARHAGPHRRHGAAGSQRKASRTGRVHHSSARTASAWSGRRRTSRKADGGRQQATPATLLRKPSRQWISHPLCFGEGKSLLPFARMGSGVDRRDYISCELCASPFPHCCRLRHSKWRADTRRAPAPAR